MKVKNYFEGYYFKHQKENHTVSFIPGRTNNTAFIQVITNDRSYNFDFPDIQINNVIKIGGCEFSNKGIKINLPNIAGEIKYNSITPIKSDIMGPFRYLPMECRHGVISMHHILSGQLVIEGQTIDFNGGIGYIEKDSGCSFPKRYAWIHCNDFPHKCSIMVSIADIPLFGFNFTGCICVIIYGGKEYRLATYRAVKIIHAKENQIVLQQGRYCLKIDLQNSNSHPLFSPQNGHMTGIIHESNCVKAQFQFFNGRNHVFNLKSHNVSFEYHM